MAMSGNQITRQAGHAVSGAKQTFTAKTEAEVTGGTIYKPVYQRRMRR